jgi:hypothetical protein
MHAKGQLCNAAVQFVFVGLTAVLKSWPWLTTHDKVLGHAESLADASRNQGWKIDPDDYRDDHYVPTTSLSA